MNSANEDLSLKEMEARAVALELELGALRSAIAVRRAQIMLPEEPAASAIPLPPHPQPIAPGDTPPVHTPPPPATAEEAPVASSLRLCGYLSDNTLWDIAIPFSAIAREGGVTIGRDAAMADIPLPDSGVSRVHLRLILNEQGLAVCDMGSTNGTFINSTPLTLRDAAYPLTDGDTLTIGTLNIRADLLF